VQVLLAAVDRGVALLDLSQVDDVDEAAVGALAGLRPRCSLLACPRWLELWLGRVRLSSGR
jgi:anti-anti-sigma regulatory factor